jgi:secreted Zn-dependent insulinase-like peptidase
LHIVVQSNHKDPAYLDGRVDNFIASFIDEFTNTASPSYIDEKALTEFKQATIEKLLEQPKNLNEDTQQLMEEIRQNTYLFDRKEALAAYLKPLAPETELRPLVIDFMQKYILDVDKRCKFTSMFYGAKHCLVKAEGSSDMLVIRDPVAFKQSMKLLPYTSYDEAYQPVHHG